MGMRIAVSPKDLGYRRVQRTGRGSYIISLPKGWVDNIGLDKGSQLAFQILDDSSLLLIPRNLLEDLKSADTQLREHHITIRSDDDPQSLRRSLISLYVTGADVIQLHYQNIPDTTAFLAITRDLVRNSLLGTEIIDETAEGITIQILINHLEFPVERALRRMVILALSSNMEAIKSLERLPDAPTQNVFTLHNDVNRLGLYIIRQLKYGLERDLYKELEFQTPKEFLGYRIVVNDVKNISTNARNIVRHVSTLYQMIEDQTLFLKNLIDEEIYQQIIEFNATCHSFFNSALTALFKRDYRHADENITKLESYARQEINILTTIVNKKLDPNISALFRIILDSSRRILEYSRNIAEVALNRTVEDYLQRME